MFDRSVEKVVTGTVVRWQFNFPHSWLYLNVKNPDGTETLWSFEGSAPPGLLQRGITGSTFEPGATHDLVLSAERRPSGGRPRLGEARQRHVLNPADGGCDGRLALDLAAELYRRSLVRSTSFFSQFNRSVSARSGPWDGNL